MSNEPSPRKPSDIAIRRDQVARLTAEGLSPVQIAQQLRVSIFTLSRDLDIVVKQWRRQLKRDPATARAYELAKINRLEAAAWEAWQRSCGDEESSKVALEGDKKRAEKATKNQSGNPKFLDRVAWCIERRLGILAPPDPRDSLEEGKHADNITVEQRRQRILALLDVFCKRKRVKAARKGIVDLSAGDPTDADSTEAVG